MKKFIGKFEDLKKVRSFSYNGKTRYYCPYCDTVHGKTPDTEGCLSFNQKTLSGYCFRCGTVVTHDGLKDLEYVQSQLLQKEEETNKTLLKVDWLKPVFDNPEVLDYMHSRYITNYTLKRFNIRACDTPDGVVFINKIIDDEYTDFMQARFVNDPDFKHAFLKDLQKKLCWLHLADTNNLIICEGFTDGLSAYQHSKGSLNPIIVGGKTITDQQLGELKDFCKNYKEVNIVVCMDGGFFEDTLKVANRIYQSCYNTIVKVMPMPYNKDLNEITSADYKIQFEKCLQFEPSKVGYIRNKVYGNKV